MNTNSGCGVRIPLGIVVALGLPLAAAAKQPNPASAQPPAPLQPAPLQPAPPQPAPPQQAAPPNPADSLPSGLVPPRLLNEASLIYPADLAAQVPPPSGRIVVAYVVAIDGTTKEIKINQGVHPALDALASQAVAALRYEPATYNGQTVEVALTLALDVAPPAPAPPVNPPNTTQQPIPEVVAPTNQATPSPSLPNNGQPTSAQPIMVAPERIMGVVLQAGDRTPVSNATVLAIPAGDLPVGAIRKKVYEPSQEPAWTYRAQTDAEGHFTLRGVPDGKVHLIIQCDGYERIEYVVMLAANEVLELKYFQPRADDNPYRTVVEVDREIAVEITRRVLKVEELTKIPGTQGDALKSLQNLPGVARAPFGIGQLVIRGASPADSRTYFGNHEIPQLFHFGGLSSVVNSDVLTQIDFIPGNFDSRFGDAIGGIVNVAPRKGRRDGYHGYVDSDIIDTGVLFEGPVGKGSLILSGRRSYIDLLLPAFIPKDSNINFTVAPRYYDYQAFFDYPVRRNGNISARVFGSNDMTKLLFSRDNDSATDARNRAETEIGFVRADLNYDDKFGKWDSLISGSYAHNAFDLNFGGQFRFKLGVHVLSWRQEMSRTLGPKTKIRFGTEMQHNIYDIAVEAQPIPTGNTPVEGQRTRQETKGMSFQPALYTTLVWQVGDRVTLYPGARFGLYAAEQARGPLFFADPRIRGTWQVSDKTTFKAAVGLFSQTPPLEQRSRFFGNPALGLEKSLHTSIAIERTFLDDVQAEVTLFHKHMWDLSASSVDLIERPDTHLTAARFQNTGIGRAYGAEVLIRKPLTRNFFGWVSYTLMRSERKQTNKDRFILFDQDQTHILTLVASYKLPRRWQIGGRFRLISGNPTTPILGATFDASDGGYIPITGRSNSDRLPMFHQLDLRIDKTWVKKRYSMTAYLDLINAYNASNTEFFRYSFDYAARLPVTSLPIIPAIGAKLEF